MRVKKCKAALALALAIAVSAPAAALSTPAVVAEAAAAVKLSVTKKTLNVGKSFTLKLNNASGKVMWKSSKKSVATVTSKGKVKAVAAGTATITATNKKKTYKCRVTVKDPSAMKRSVKVGPVKLTYPGSFVTDVAELDGNYVWVALDAKKAEAVTQALTVKLQYTGEEAYDYDTMLGMYEGQISVETMKANYEILGIEAEITNYELSFYESKLGKAIRVTYHVSLEAEGGKTEEDAAIYLIGVNDYILELDAEAVNGGKFETVDGYAKNLLDTMVVL